MKQFITYLFISFSAIVSGQIPDKVLHASDSIIISRIGLNNFNNWLTVYPQPGLPKNIRTEFDIYYKVKIPDMPETSVCIRMNYNGKPFIKNLTVGPNNPNRGIPDCKNHPELCKFLTKDEVTKIAEKQLFEKGMAVWTYEFVWVNVNLFNETDKLARLLAGRYVWRISNTLFAENCTTKGKTLEIDASTGQVKNLGEWSSYSAVIGGCK